MTLQPPLEGLTDYRLSDRNRIVQALAKFRREWQKIAGSESLVSIETPVGLLLSDLADQLELTSQERDTILGGRLINEVNAFMEQHVSLDLPS